MKKKLISIVAAMAVVSAFGTAAMAEDKAPEVFIDSAQIMFADQEPVILGEGYTVVPARGVFEAMGATVTWDGETRMVEVESDDHKTIVRLTIDDSTMRVYDVSNMFGSILTTGSFQAPETLVTLDVAPQIISDRTMIPLRAISEALDADVQWDGDAYAIYITTGDAPLTSGGLPAYMLSASSNTVSADETVDIYVEAQNLPESVFVAGVVATVEYDKENFEFVEANLVNGDMIVENAISAVNPDFDDSRLKAVFVTIDDVAAAKTDGKILKLTFRSINGGEGAFALSKSYNTDLGYNTTLQLDKVDENGELIESTMYKGNDLFIYTDPLWINSAAE